MRPPRLRYLESQEVKLERRRRDAMCKTLRMIPPGPSRDAMILAYLECLSRIRKLLRELQSNQFAKWANELDNSPASDITKTVARINKARTARGGSALKNTPVALEEYRIHFAKQLTLVDPNKPVASVDPVASDTEVVTCQEVAQAIRATPNRKAPGISGLKAEVIKAGGWGAAEC